jgi:hypothetical protein
MPSKLAAFRLDPSILEGLQTIKERDGIPLSVQVRRALIAWIAEHGINEKTIGKADRRRAQTRRRS